MSAITTLVEGEYTLTTKTRTYKVRSIIDKQLQADFARWCFDRAVTDLAAARALYTEEEYDKERVKLREAHRRGEFNFKSKHGAEVVATIDGLTFIASKLIVDVDEAEVVGVMVETAEHFKELLKQIILDSFPELRHIKKAKELMTKKVKRRPKR